MVVAIIIIVAILVAIGILALVLIRKEKTSEKEEVINKPSEPSIAPVDEVPTDETEKPKDEAQSIPETPVEEPRPTEPEQPQEPTPAVEVPKEEQKEPEPVLGNPAPTKETTELTFGECICAFKEYVSIPINGATFRFLRALYIEAEGQFGLKSYSQLPLLYKEENFPNIYSIYGDKKDEGAAFNTMMGFMFALLLAELKPKKRTQILRTGYELGGYSYNSPVFGYEFKSSPYVAILVGSMVLSAMRGKYNPDINAMRAEVGGTSYPYVLSYYLDLGQNHLKTAEDIQKNVISKSGFYVDFRQFLPSSAGPYDAKYKNRPTNIMSDAKDEYLNTEMDRKIHEFIVAKYNLDNPDPEIHQRVVQAIADKEQSTNHLYGSDKTIGDSSSSYSFHPVFGNTSIGKMIPTTGATANLTFFIQAIATYFRIVLQNKADSPAYFGRLRPGCSWTQEKKKNSETDDRRNVLVNICIEDNDGQKTSSYGYDDDGIWRATEVEASQYAEHQKNHLGANSYPSGHSSGIWCVGMMLAEAMPGRTDLIMRACNEFAENRTITRFHWRSDTIFGRIVGSVANALCHATADYATLLKAVKKELGI